MLAGNKDYRFLKLFMFLLLSADFFQILTFSKISFLI